MYLHRRVCGQQPHRRGRAGCGGVLWAASAVDGSKLAEYTLDVLPAWDGMAAAYGKLFIVNQDGSIDCWGAGPE